MQKKQDFIDEGRVQLKCTSKAQAYSPNLQIFKYPTRANNACRKIYEAALVQAAHNTDLQSVLFTISNAKINTAALPTAPDYASVSLLKRPLKPRVGMGTSKP